MQSFGSRAFEIQDAGLHEGQDDFELFLVKSRNIVCCYKSTFYCLCNGIVLGMLDLKTGPSEPSVASVPSQEILKDVFTWQKKICRFQTTCIFRNKDSFSFNSKSHTFPCLYSDPYRCFPHFVIDCISVELPSPVSVHQVWLFHYFQFCWSGVSYSSQNTY